LKIRTLYLIPEDVSKNNWKPKEKGTGVGFWNIKIN